MPTKTLTKTQTSIAAAKALPSIPKELIDQFVMGPMSGEAVNAASVAFKKALIERAMGAELSHHLGYSPGAVKPESTSNHRNGSTGKTVLTDDGPLRIEVPRDREGSFEPVQRGRGSGLEFEPLARSRGSGLDSCLPLVLNLKARTPRS